MKDGNWKIYPSELTKEADSSILTPRPSPEIKKALSRMYEKVKKNKPGIIKQLHRLIQKYPDVPTFKNYLLMAHLNKDARGKAREVSRHIQDQHPDYLFGKVSLASYYLDQGLYEEIPGILGEHLELKALYPRKLQFHISEVVSYYRVVFRYHLEREDLEKAEMSLEHMRRLIPRHAATKKLVYQLMAKRMELNVQREEEFISSGRTVAGRSYDRSIQTNRKPYFQHPYEMQALYRNDLRISRDIINRILRLPRESLVQDLNLVLRDSIRRFEFFQNQVEEKGWNEKVHNFQLHALYMLTELQAAESLPVVLDLMRQGKGFVGFWFTDHLIETLWEVIYYLGRQQLDLLKKFSTEPNIYTLCKDVVSTAVAQIIYHEPERRQEVIGWYREVLQFFVVHSDRPDIYDAEVASRMVVKAFEFKGYELYPVIRELSQRGLIAEYLSDDLERFERDVEKRLIHEKYKRPLFNIYERYQYIIRTWYSFNKRYRHRPPER